METTQEQVSTTQKIFIRHSSKFYGYYEVVTPKEIIPCQNYSTAKTYKTLMIRHAHEEQQAEKENER